MTILQIRNKQLVFAKKLEQCLRGFTLFELRPLSHRYQNRFDTWYQAYTHAESYHQRMIKRANNLIEIEEIETVRVKFAQKQKQFLQDTTISI